jgi:ABC-type amino acid transport substrate-binding protein
VSSKCIDALKNGTVDALSTHGPIGAGYVSKDPDDLEMLGRPFYADNPADGALAELRRVRSRHRDILPGGRGRLR